MGYDRATSAGKDVSFGYISFLASSSKVIQLSRANGVDPGVAQRTAALRTASGEVVEVTVTANAILGKSTSMALAGAVNLVNLARVNAVAVGRPYAAKWNSLKRLPMVVTGQMERKFLTP